MTQDRQSAPEIGGKFFESEGPAVTSEFHAIGVGSLMVDLVANVDDDFPSRIGREKGGMELVDSAKMESILSGLKVRAADEIVRATGGSAANTIQGLARLGLKCTLLGKVGADDDGAFYRHAVADDSVDTTRFKSTDTTPTGRCLCLVTPDTERTMCTDLGAAGTLAAGEVNDDDFQNCAYAHIEGYMLFNKDLIRRILEAAASAGCAIGLDLASFEVVEANRDRLSDMLESYIDIVYANEDEAAAFCGLRDPAAGLAALARHCAVAAVKLGTDGALLQRGEETATVKAEPVTAVDTTGAGDLWASGFIYGCFQGCDLGTCGAFGAIVGAEVVQVSGATIAADRWMLIRERLA